jgi:hypothetical protein
MPNVVCMNLQQAQDTIQTTGVFFSRSQDGTGQGRSQFIDSNWVVVAQTPPPGTPFGGRRHADRGEVRRTGSLLKRTELTGRGLLSRLAVRSFVGRAQAGMG